MPTFLRLEPEPSKASYLPYAPAVEVSAGSEYFFFSGLTAASFFTEDRDDPELPESAGEQTRHMMSNLTELLSRLDMNWSNVVHIYEFLTDMSDTDEVHGAMFRHLVEHPDADESWTPASTLIGVNTLRVRGARVEFDFIAAKPPSGPVSARPRPKRVSGGGLERVASVASDEELLWMSGSTAIDFYHHHPHHEDEEDVPYRASDQVAKIFDMFDPVLHFMEVGWSDVVKLYVWATDSRDLPAFGQEIDKRLAALAEHPPTTTVDIDALSGPPARLELEMIATRGPKPDEGAPSTDAQPLIEMLHSDLRRAHVLPYAPVVRVADAPLHFISGIGPNLAESEGALPTQILEQMRLLLESLDRHLEALGLRWTNVVKVIQHVIDIRDEEIVVSALAERYGTSWAPAVTLTQVDALPRAGARVQFDVILAG